MQIFEFQFNPKKKGHRVETLSYEAKGDSRNLYLVGEMRKIILGDEKFLLKIIKMIKDEYIVRDSESPEESLKNSLIKVNEYLSIEIAKNNVNWLGNIHLAAISVSGSDVSIAKIGDIEIFLINYGKVKELDERIKSDILSNNEDFRPKTFKTVISGKLAKSERILIVSKEPITIFKKEKILDKISELPFLDRKIMEKMIDSTKKEFLKISGVFFLLDTKKPLKSKKPFFSENEIDFSFKEIILSAKGILKRFFLDKKNRKKIFLPTIKMPEIKIRKETKKGLTLIFLLVSVLLLGFLIFR